MNWTYLSLLVAGILPIICAGIAKSGFKGYDNRDGRAWLARQTGFRARANAAQANSFEAFPFFACGAILCLVTGVDRATLDALCLLFIGSRIAYIACYVADKATLRTVVWAVGWFTTIALYILAIRGA